MITPFSLLFFALAACRSPGGATVEDEEGDETEAAAGPCADVEAVSTAKLTGRSVFDLTARCVFDASTHELRLHVLGETFEKVLADGCADRDSGFGHVISFELDGKRIDDVGIKVRGNTSKCNAKRQFKFKFDAKQAFSVNGGVVETRAFPENDGRTFFGLEGLSVRASANDPAQVREAAASKLFTGAGVDVYRLGYTKIFLTFGRTQAEGAQGTFNRLKEDGLFYEYRGLFELAENIDKTFLRERFQVGDGKLKLGTLVEADKTFATFDRAAFKPEGWSFELVDGEKADTPEKTAAGQAKLFALMDLLANAPTEDQLAQAIDVDSVAGYVAATLVAGHWDSMLANGNNDYLYLNGDTQKWQMITWDLDNTLGAANARFHALVADDPFAAAKLHKQKLFEVLFAPEHPNLKAKLRQKLDALLAGPASEAAFNKTIDTLAAQVRAGTEAFERPKAADFQNVKNFVRARRAALAPK
jgi:spore coat protein CotH